MQGLQKFNGNKEAQVQFIVSQAMGRIRQWDIQVREFRPFRSKAIVAAGQQSINSSALGRLEPEAETARVLHISQI